MPKHMQARTIEILSITAGNVIVRKITKEMSNVRTTKKSVVLITYRPDPANSHRSEIVAVTTEQAQRMRDDLDSILNVENLSWM
ncbi:hypothetical protein [Gimesia chilikensis]|uniref:Uncharacterized protein n=1 Tax=Gimesia chilikensis TaxID=2605989 RepID=A0A517PY98_9PLAN|nr:hypothetical protein [Gimesia chilikensis]QDT24339.1 hypothetical protein HG66A1_61710 [Gimesia chilikensis]